MNLIKNFLLKKLSVLQKLIEESNTQTYLNKDFVWVIYVSTRFSYLLLMNQFCEKEYEDDKLALFKNIINWTTFFTPIESINSDNLRRLILIFIMIFHWLAVSVLIGFNYHFLKQFSIKYFTYFQILFLYPSFCYINYSIQNNADIILANFTTLPIVLNYILFTYLQRNYSLQVRNHFIKRYKVTNYLIMLTDFIVLLSLPLLTETSQTPILIFVFFAQMIDSIYIQPYSQIMNAHYCICSSIIFYGSLFKYLCCLFGDNQHFFYYNLLITPLLSLVNKKYMFFISYQLKIEHEITQETIISIADLFYSQNDIIKLIIIYQLKTRFKIKNNNIQYIIQVMFNEALEQQNPLERYKDENLYLYNILFLKRNSKNQNLGYIKLKKYFLNSTNRSLYFQIIENNYIFVKPIEKETLGRLQLANIRQSEKLQEESLPLGIKILEQKILFWESLLVGYIQIEDFSDQTIRFCKKVDQLKTTIFTQLNLNISSLTNDLNRLNILDLRLLSFLFGSILNDYHITLEIEQSIDKVLAYERNLQTVNIINTTLLYDNVIITPVSMMKNPGEIVSKNRKQLQNFFQFPNDNQFLEIKNINQLLPDYLKASHNSLMKRFLASGESELFTSHRIVFPVSYTGFSFNATIQLIHFLDQKDDYVIAAVLRKVIENNDFIIFDPCGKIIGITESVHNLLVFEEMNQIRNKLLQSYIFFWFSDLIQSINENYNGSAGSSTEIDKVFNAIIQPLTNLENVINQFETFKRQNQYQYTATNTIRTEQELVEEIELKDQQTKRFPCFEKDYVSQIMEFVNLYLQQSDCEVYYAVQFRVFLHQFSNHFPIFLLQVQDFQQRGNRKCKSGCSFGTTSAYYQTQKISNTFTQEIMHSNFELDELHQEFIVNQSIVNKLINNKKSNPAEFKKVTESININDNQKSIDYRESNLISPRSNREILIQNEIIDDEDEIGGKESQIEKSSSQKNVKENIEVVLQRERNAEQNDKQDLMKSKSSATSDTFQNSIYNLIRNLSYTNQIQTSILKAIFITNAFSLFFFTLIIVELNIYRQNTSELQFNIPLVRIPQRFNRLYCTFVTLGQLRLQQQLLNQSYGNYYNYRITNFSSQTRNELASLMIDLKNNFALLEAKGKLPDIEVRIINEYIFEQQNMTMIQFDSMINEQTEKIDQQLQSNTDGTQIQILLEFLKGNLLKYLALTISVVEQIENQFFSLIDSYETDYFTFLIILLLIIFVFLILQFKQWQQPYKYIQQILLLIAKISEKDIDSSCLRLYYTLEKVKRDPLQWKHINYFRDLFWLNRVSTYQTVKGTSQMMIYQGNKKQQRVKQISRITETSFSLANIWMILLFLWLLLSGVAISYFLMIKINMDSSQPVLLLTMEYVKFKQDLDGVMILCQLLKNQQILIEQTMQSGIFSHNAELNTKNKYFSIMYSEMLNKFSPLVSNIESTYLNLYNDLSASEKLSDSNRAYLLNLYQNDLCDILQKSLPFCNYTNGNFFYFPTYPQASDILNNKLIFKYGINGIYQQIKNIFNTHFSLELNGQEDTNLPNIKEFLESPDYIQVVLPYFFDLSFAILEFYYSILKASIDMLETDYDMALIYFIVSGIVSIIILYLTILIRAFTLQKKVKFIRQALIVIPYESLQDQSVLNVIKRIERSK